MGELIAIPYPAPSIPARFRLYHGGWAMGGQLHAHSPSRSAYVGPYVYFSPRKAYAASYAEKRWGLPARGRRSKKLFVIDARQLASGCRVVTGADAVKSIGGVFWDRIDFGDRVEWWASGLASQGVRSWHLKSAPRVAIQSANPHDAPPLLAQWISGIRAVLLAEGSDRNDLRGLQSKTIDQLQRLRTALGLTDELTKLSGTAALGHDGYVSHRLNDPLLFALERHGTLALDEATVRELEDEHARAWITMYTRPFDMNALLGYRDRAEAVQAQWIQEEGIHWDGHMRSRSSAALGDIVMVPGPIQVLRSGFEGIRRGGGDFSLSGEE